MSDAGVSTEAGRWLKRRVQVFAGFDHQKMLGPMAEGVVVGYAAAPTICVRSDDGRQSDWQVTLPITVLAEDAEIPRGSDDWAIVAAARRVVAAMDQVDRDAAAGIPTSLSTVELAAVLEGLRQAVRQGTRPGG